MDTIEGQALATWAILPGGEQVCLSFTASNGETYRIILPFLALTGLLMTLPRILQTALDERFPDAILRVVHPLRNVGKAHKLAKSIHAGSVWINRRQAIGPGSAVNIHSGALV